MNEVMKPTQGKNGRSHRTRNMGAAMVGAAQGLREGLQEEHLGEESVRAIHNIGAVARAAGKESRHQWRSEEIQQVRGDFTRTKDQAVHKIQDVSSDATATLRRGKDRVQHQTERWQHKTSHLTHEGMYKVQAVGRSAKRARQAPAHIKQDLQEATESYKKSMGIAAATYGGLAVLGTTAFIILSVGLVVAFNLLFGTPVGYFLTFGLYAIAAGAVYMLGRGKRDEHTQEAREHVKDIGREVRYVAQPVRLAFNKEHKVKP